MCLTQNVTGEIVVLTIVNKTLLDDVLLSAMKAALEAVEMSKCKRFVLDFTNVTYQSSSFLGLFLAMDKRAKTAKAKLVLCGICSTVLEVFAITKLDKTFKIVKTLEDAITFLQD